ncbi:MAG: restriction endonuclease subunit S [Proteobacteria bacterium]|nr:restriction endonuclease subunit S [Pseudomonadota bacterium]
MSFPRYPTYKESGVEWLGKVPTHWKQAPLKAIATCNDDVLDETTAPDTEIVYVDISGVDSINGISSKEVMEFSDAPSRARRRVKHGDVILSTVRTYLRAIARIRRPAGNLIVSTGFAVIRPRSELNADFAGYMLSANYFIEQVIARSTGVSYPAINASELVAIPVVVPPLQEQTFIAAFLDRETAKIDALVAEQRRLIELLKEKRQAAISHAVTKGLNPDVPSKPSGIEWLGDVPAHWTVTRLGNLFREVAGPGNEELPILSVSIHHGVSDEEVAEEDMDRKVTRSEDRSKYVRVEPGDLVYNMMRAWQGGFGAVTVPGMVSPAYVVARPRVPLNSTYIEHLLRTPQAIEQMRRHSKGVTDFRLRLYWDEFKNIEIALPPEHEAKAIRERIRDTAEQFQRLSAAAEQAIELLQEHRTALVSAAVTGQIDVRAHADAEAA